MESNFLENSIKNMVMKNNHSIAILMATYNGARYLAAQIDSILAQTNHEWELFVHDDGSSDDTMAILKDYELEYPELIHVMPKTLKFGGARDNFMWILENVESEYYMFCDQDDIWLPYKIEITYDKIKDEETKTPNIPLMVYTDLCVADKFGFPAVQSSWRMAKMQSRWFDSLDAYLVMCKCAGCTTIINNLAKRVSLPMDRRAFMHDWWIALKTWSSGGKCVALNKSTILYRQHGDNECGAPAYGRTSWWKDRLGKLRSTWQGNLLMLQFMKDNAKCSSAKYRKAKVHVVLRRLFP